MKVAFLNESSQGLGIQYIGIRYISAVLKAGGHNVELFVDPLLFNDNHCSIKRLSRIFDFKKEIIAQLKSYNPDIVGISVVTETYQWACQMARLIKQEIDVPIIFGGIHPTSVPERVIKNDFVDIVCVGEGEYPMLELVNSMQRGKIDYSIKNLWFKKDGKVIKNEPRVLIDNLNELPLTDQELYVQWNGALKIGYYLAASRGCPNMCSYCCHSYLRNLYKGKGNYVRCRSVENVIEELIKAKYKYGMKRALFTDDCFGYDKEWLKEFSVEYKKKIDLPFFCIMQPYDVTEETLRHLKSAGCRLIFLGIQSWDKELRENLLNRYVSNDCMEQAIQIIKNKKIQVVVDNLFGLPGQSNKHVLESNMRFTRLRPNRIFFFKLRYYPKTAILNKAVKDGFVSAKRYEEIVDGADQSEVCVRKFFSKRNAEEKKIAKIKMLLFNFDFLPGKLIAFILKKKLYQYFPTFIDMSIFMLFRTLVSRDLDSRLRFEEAVWKYTYFIKRKLFCLFRGNK